MSSTASLMALIASTAMRGISVVRGVSEEISGMSCSLVGVAVSGSKHSHVSKQAQ